MRTCYNDWINQNSKEEEKNHDGKSKRETTKRNRENRRIITQSLANQRGFFLLFHSFALIFNLQSLIFNIHVQLLRPHIPRHNLGRIAWTCDRSCYRWMPVRIEI